MGMVAILISGPRRFVQIFNPPLTEVGDTLQLHEVKNFMHCKPAQLTIAGDTQQLHEVKKFMHCKPILFTFFFSSEKYTPLINIFAQSAGVVNIA